MSLFNLLTRSIISSSTRTAWHRINVSHAVRKLRALTPPAEIPTRVYKPTPRKQGIVNIWANPSSQGHIRIDEFNENGQLLRKYAKSVYYTLAHAAKPRVHVIPAPLRPVPCSECGQLHVTEDALDDYYRCSDCTVVCGECHEPLHPDDELDAFDRGSCCSVSCCACDDIVESVNDYEHCEDCEIFCGECHEPAPAVDAWDRGTECCSLRCSCCGESCESLDIHDECEHCQEPPASDVIHSYSYKPTAEFFEYFRHKKQHFSRSQPRKGTLYFGVEVETEAGDNDREEIQESLSSHSSYASWYGKEDASLTYGIEHVSHPISIERWRTQRDTKWMDEARAMGLRAWDTDTCGLHIHFPKSYLTRTQLYKLLRFFALNKPYIIRVAGRDSRFAGCYGHKANHIRQAKQTYNRSNRSSPINTRPRNTYECRIFRGTLNRTSFLRNLNWLAAVLGFVKHTSLHKLSLDDFHAFLRSPRAKDYLGKSVKSILEFSLSKEP